MDLGHLTLLLKGRGLRLCVTCTTKIFVAGDGGVSWCRLQVRSLLVLHFKTCADWLIGAGIMVNGTSGSGESNC